MNIKAQYTIDMDYDSFALLQAYYDSAYESLSTLVAKHTLCTRPIDWAYLDVLISTAQEHGAKYLKQGAATHPAVGAALKAVMAEAQRYSVPMSTTFYMTDFSETCPATMEEGLEAGTTEMKYLERLGHTAEGQDSAVLYMYTYFLAALHALRDWYKTHIVCAYRSATMLEALAVLIEQVVQMCGALPS